MPSPNTPTTCLFTIVGCNEWMPWPWPVHGRTYRYNSTFWLATRFPCLCPYYIFYLKKNLMMEPYDSIDSWYPSVPSPQSKKEQVPSWALTLKMGNIVIPSKNTTFFLTNLPLAYELNIWVFLWNEFPTEDDVLRRVVKIMGQYILTPFFIIELKEVFLLH